MDDDTAGAATIVVDAAVVACALVDEGEDGGVVRSRLTRPLLTVVAPDGLDLRVGHVLGRLVAADLLTTRRAEQALADLADLPLERVPHWPFLTRAWQLRERLDTLAGVTVAAAEAFGATLVVADRRYGVVGARCPVELV